MGQKLPYLIAPGTVVKIFDKVKEARQPEIFTGDFLSTKLGFKSGNARPIIPLMKKMGFLNTDGKPTEIYAKFRNDNTSKWAMAQGIKSAYTELYDMNEYVHDLSRNDLANLVIQYTGMEKGNTVVTSIVSTFEALKSFADFEVEAEKVNIEKHVVDEDTPETDPIKNTQEVGPAMFTNQKERVLKSEENVGFNLSYTINLNLPETTNIEVFNAIFKSLKENMLKK